MANIEIDLNTPAGAQQIADILIGSVCKAAKLAGIETLRQLYISTPVDTGRARWGWYCTINAPSPDLPPEGNYTFPDVVSRAAEINAFTITDTIFIANNVPYVPKLNGGSSKQAPARFVEKAAARGEKAAVAALRKK